MKISTATTRKAHSPVRLSMTMLMIFLLVGDRQQQSSFADLPNSGRQHEQARAGVHDQW